MPRLEQSRYGLLAAWLVVPRWLADVPLRRVPQVPSALVLWMQPCITAPCI